MEPKFVSLKMLFDGRLFKVPQYQRSYSWKKKHCVDLLDDIKNSFKKGKKPHFMATVVGLRRKEEVTMIVTDEYHPVDIVDGQQRITTLVMLYKAISNELGKTDIEKKLRQGIDETLVKRDATSVLLSQTNQDIGSTHFVNYIRNGTHDPPDQAETSADRNLLEAMDSCEEFVQQWKNDGSSLVELAAHIKNRLKFIYHEIDDESLVYSVFEVLNSRGLEVSWFDRLKSILMSMLFGQKCNTKDTLDEIHNRWATIFRIIGTQQISSEILCFAATLCSSDNKRILSEEKSVDVLVDRSKNGCDRIIATTDLIEKIARSVVKIRTPNRNDAVLEIAQARLVAVAIDLRDDLTENEKTDLYNHWEKAVFPIYGICKNDARRLVGVFVSLACGIINEKISPKNIESELLSIVKECKVNEYIDTLVDEDCYTNWSKKLRYLLYRYEEHLSEKVGQKITNDQWNRIWKDSAYNTIEHILPQKSNNEYVHCLGNMFLLPSGINAKLRDAPPVDKLEEYRKTGFTMANDIIDHLAEWDENKILERGKKIAQWAKQEWGSVEP